MEASSQPSAPSVYFLLDDENQVVGQGRIPDPVAPLGVPQELTRRLVFSRHSSVDYYLQEGRVWFAFNFAADLGPDDLALLYEDCRTPAFVGQLAELCGGTCLIRWGGPRENDTPLEDADHLLIIYADEAFGDVMLYRTCLQLDPEPSFASRTPCREDLFLTQFGILTEFFPSNKGLECVMARRHLNCKQVL